MPTRLLKVKALDRLALQALLLLALAVFVGGAFAFRYYTSLPYIGFESVTGDTVGAVAASSPAAEAGLQVGDTILTIDGNRPMNSGRGYLQPGQQSLQMEILREGQFLQLEITPVRAPLAVQLDRVGYFATALSFWALAMLVLACKARDAVARLLALLTLLTAAIIAIWSLADLGAVWANLWMGVLAVAIGPLFVHYHTLFPERSHFRGRKLLLVSLYGSGAVLAVLYLSWDTVVSSDFYQQLHLAGWLSAGRAIRVHFILCVFIGLALLERAYSTTASERSKRQIAIVALGTGLGLLPLVAQILLPQVLSVGYIVPSWLPFLLLALAPASYFYATYRHDLLHLDRAFNRTVVYSFLTLTLIVLYLGLQGVVSWLMPDLHLASMSVADVLPALALAFAFQPLKRGVEKVVDRVLYGGWYDYKGFTLKMAQALNEATDASMIVRLFTEHVARTMRLKQVALMLPVEGDALRVDTSSGFERSLPDRLPEALAALLRDHKEPIEQAAVRHQFRSQPVVLAEIEAYAAVGVQLWVPLVQQGHLEGLLVLGRRQADDFFSEDDCSMLFTVGQQAAIALARARLVAELRGRLHEVEALSRRLVALQERNQQRMALEIHDQALQDIYFVRLILDGAVKDSDFGRIERAREELLRIGGYLDALILELRPPDLEEGDLGQILQTWAATFQRERELPIVVHVKGDSEGVLIPEGVKLAVYRIFQESLNNAWKHASAHQVKVTLDVRPDQVRLEVCDDGLGFEVPVHRGGSLDDNRTGLAGMEYRAAEVNGRCWIRSRPKQGTRVLVEVPLAPDGRRQASEPSVGSATVVL